MTRFGERAANYRSGAYSVHKQEGNSWRAMKSRCYSPKYRRFDLYGGRGIKVCDRWLGRDGFANFLQDMGKKPSPKHTIDRINVDGDYEPNNCRWATQEQQLHNMERTRKFTIDGIKASLPVHARRYDINPATVETRIRQLGWSVEKAIKTPAKGLGSNQTTYKSD